jgi:DNA polymerase-4
VETETGAARSILHVDMDAFFASVEQRDNPDLQGKPVVVGGTTNRGVVAAASYESRVYGIRSAMPIAEAMRRCPELIRIAPRMQAYKKASREIFRIFREFTPLVEGLSLDEAFLDVTKSRKLLGDAETMAATIKQRINEKTRLTASVGVAENKLVAKIASDLDKPDGLTVVRPADYRRVLDPLPVSVIPGIGRETLAKLHQLDIRTVAGLRVAPPRDLQTVFGRFADKMRARAAGLDDRPVVPEREEKSISAEQTYDADLTDRGDMDKQLLRLADRTAARLRKAGLTAATIQLKIREADFTTFTRQQGQQPATDDTRRIYAAARKLLDTWLAEHPGKAIRLLGVGGSNLGKPPQADLFADPSGRGKTLDKTLDNIRERFGSDSLGHARTLDKP